jgi:hypothetical protein
MVRFRASAGKSSKTVSTSWSFTGDRWFEIHLPPAASRANSGVVITRPTKAGPAGDARLSLGDREPPRRPSARRAARPAPRPARQSASSPSSRRLGMRGVPTAGYGLDHRAGVGAGHVRRASCSGSGGRRFARRSWQPRFAPRGHGTGDSMPTWTCRPSRSDHPFQPTSNKRKACSPGTVPPQE